MEQAKRSVTAKTEEGKMEKAVNYVTSKTLTPEVAPSKISAKSIANQSAAMMIQDMRAFLHANEQVITIGMGKAIALATNSKNAAVQKGGVEALAALEKLMMSLPRFAGEIEKTANSILIQFGDPNADYLKMNSKSTTVKSK